MSIFDNLKQEHNTKREWMLGQSVNAAKKFVESRIKELNEYGYKQYTYTPRMEKSEPEMLSVLHITVERLYDWLTDEGLKVEMLDNISFRVTWGEDW